MFIFCRVKENGKRCNCQAWAYQSPFDEIYKCPTHGLVDDKGNILKKIDMIKCPACHKDSKVTKKRIVSPPEIERWYLECGHSHLISINK